MKTIEHLDTKQKEAIETDFVRINEIATREGIDFLVSFATAQTPSIDILPIFQISGNQAKAMWFFLNAPEVFEGALLRYEVQQIQSWRIAHELPRVVIEDLPTDLEAWENDLCAFFENAEGKGERCRIESTSFNNSICYTAYLADYSMIYEAFDEDTGRFTVQRRRPAFEVKYVYYPEEGRLLLKSRVRQQQKIEKLTQLFCTHILRHSFDIDVQQKFKHNLNILKSRFDPPRPPEIKEIKVKELRLSFPEESGQRIIIEATRKSDRMAVYDILEKMVSRHDLDYLNVTRAVIQFRFNQETNYGNVTVTLTHPNACTLNQTVHHELVRRLLKEWRVLHG